MIKIFFYKKNNKNFFEIYGHANSSKNNDEYDLICGGVSAIVFGILNSIDDKKNEIIIKENKITIYFLEDTNENDIIYKILFNSLKTIEKDHKKYIKIDNDMF